MLMTELMTKSTPSSVLARQSGSFIIEALISLLLFAVALIGLIGLSAQALNQVGQSKSRNDASYLAGDLLAQMWVSGSVDLDTWNDRLAEAIPSATGDVYLANCDCLDSAANACAAPSTGTVILAKPQPVTICIKWTDRKDSTTPRRYSTSSVISRN